MFYMRSVEEAFRAVSRSDFLLNELKGRAENDTPLSIGHGQTNSQPFTVNAMLDWLEVDEGQIILDVGSGSGWTSALLAYLTGETGHVYAVEAIPELVAFGQKNCERLGIENISFHHASKIIGLPEKAPFDRILVSASASRFPDELVDQLAAPGKLVVPIGETIYEVHKDEEGDLSLEDHPGFTFVPLVGV